MLPTGLGFKALRERASLITKDDFDRLRGQCFFKVTNRGWFLLTQIVRQLRITRFLFELA